MFAMNLGVRWGRSIMVAWSLLICAAALIGSTGMASAERFEFSMSAFGDVVVNGRPVTIETVTVTGTGDTDNVTFDGISRYGMILDTTSITYRGRSVNFLEPIELFRAGGTIGLSADDGASFISFSADPSIFPDLVKFKLASNFNLDFADGVQCCAMDGSFTTNAGTLTRFSGANAPLAFRAIVKSDVVPLPFATIFLLCCLVGMFVALRRARK